MRSKLYAVLSLFLLSACSGDSGDGLGTGLGSGDGLGSGGGLGTGSAGSVSYAGQIYPLSNSIAEVFRPSDNHWTYELNVSDGEFYSTQLLILGSIRNVWRPRAATVWIRADMFSPGFEEFQAGTFAYAADSSDDDPALAQRFFFNEGRFAADVDRNSDFDDDEFLDITSGTITLSGQKPNVTVEYDLVLENGVSVSGRYTGDVIDVDKVEVI